MKSEMYPPQNYTHRSGLIGISSRVTVLSKTAATSKERGVDDGKMQIFVYLNLIVSSSKRPNIVFPKRLRFSSTPRQVI